MSVTSWWKLSAFCAVMSGLPVSVSGAFRQDRYNVLYGEVPFLPFRIPRHANLLILEKLDCVIVRCFHLIPPFCASHTFLPCYHL